jgi:hypothetical protein
VCGGELPHGRKYADNPVTEHRLRLAGIVATVGAWVFLLLHEILPAIGAVTQGFAAYYTASFAILHSGAADLNNNALFAAWLPRAGVNVQEVYQGNTPTLALLMAPLTVFSPAVAQMIWLVLNVVMLIGCTWLAGRIVAADNPAARWWIAATFATLAPVRETLRFGQVYLLVGLLTLLAVKSLIQRRDTRAGIAVAVIGLLKAYYGVLTFGLLIWSRRPRSLVATLATVVLIVVVSLPLLGPAWPDYIGAQVGIGDVASSSIPANQTLHSAVQHLLVYVPDWNPSPVADIPVLALALRYALLITLVAGTLGRALRHDPLWIWLPALTIMPALAPVGEAHHYTILLLPVAVAVTRVISYIEHKPDSGMETPFEIRRIRWTTALILLAGLFLLVTPWPSLRDVTIWSGWRGLLAYPRLLGALLLWIGL